ncbi:MAG: cob(I)yrinic acid a,c-diamide adenosyltransferase [Acidobacteria bacterium]|nr:MAG: cob(I)yrinic acid a,c-diamide adenosyltransferase [Acidobacteriota bacterium]TDI42791.1 MAG: cob(I)yrinic acid a,c-diamide adenosyltransferase [Acidobacteriota bacterium]
MPRITRVYTRTGDDGSTALGDGARVAKDAVRVRAFGTVDELNSMVGVVRAAGLHEDLAQPMATVQNELFHLGAELCRPPAAGAPKGPCIEERHVQELEKLMDRLMVDLPPLENFVLPTGTPAAAHLHMARAICRRAERRVLTLSREESVGPHALIYLNRLSDALFVMARYENLRHHVPDTLWDSRA